MDPSEIVGRVTSCFQEKDYFDHRILPEKYSSIPKDFKTEIKKLDLQKYIGLENIYHTRKYEDFIKRRYYPFENISLSIFSHRDALILANIDAIYHLTGNNLGYVGKQTRIPDYSYALLECYNPGFFEYLQWRLPASYGYFFSNYQLEYSKFNNKTFEVKSGNVIYDSLNYSSFLEQKNKKGLQLVIGSGLFQVKEYKKQEFYSSRILLSESLLAIKTLASGGSLVLRTGQTLSRISAEIIFILSQCFNTILFFRPVSLDPNNQQKYLICLNLRENIKKYQKILQEVYKSYTDFKYIYTFISDLPRKFETWFKKQNNIITVYRESSKYNWNKLLISWGLPE